jgi:hypothetical protein
MSLRLKIVRTGVRSVKRPTLPRAHAQTRAAAATASPLAFVKPAGGHWHRNTIRQKTLRALTVSPIATDAELHRGYSQRAKVRLTADFKSCREQTIADVLLRQKGLCTPGCGPWDRATLIARTHDRHSTRHRPIASNRTDRTLRDDMPTQSPTPGEGPVRDDGVRPCP